MVCQVAAGVNEVMLKLRALFLDTTSCQHIASVEGGVLNQVSERVFSRRNM